MKRAATWSAVAIVAVFGIIGALHTPPFRALLMKAACPLGGEALASDAQREATRRFALGGRWGSMTAPTHLVSGLEVGRATRAQVDAWLTKNQAICTESKLVRQCELESLRTFGVEHQGTVFLRSNEHGTLVALAVTAKLNDEEAPKATDAMRQKLETTLGSAHHQHQGFGTALLSQSRAEHHFTDLIASVSRTQMGDGVRLNLELQSM